MKSNVVGIAEIEDNFKLRAMVIYIVHQCGLISFLTSNYEMKYQKNILRFEDQCIISRINLCFTC